jgi:hypothetical protein
VKVRAAKPIAVPILADAPRVSFGGQLRLLSAQLDRSTYRPGDTINLTLDWQAARLPEQDYTVFVHLVDEDRQIAAQADSQPQQARYPTSWWDAGEVVIDSHAIGIPATAHSGVYHIEIGLYQLVSGQRLPLDGRAGDSMDVAQLEIAGAP